ncbi:MAG: ABC transporter ATP-binding protein [Acidimicrobiales bacterium]
MSRVAPEIAGHLAGTGESMSDAPATSAGPEQADKDGDSELDRRDAIVVEGVSKCFGGGDRRVVALDGVSMSVKRGDFVTVIGPSGCGKTTLLRIVGGLLGVDSGTVSIFGESVARAIEAKRIGFVPQSPALLPWRTVLDNVRLPLEVNKRAGGTAAHETADPVAVLESLGLGSVLHRRPAQLSGGMQQRVAIARAFVFDPPILLMDEPFAAVDELTRESLRHELLSIWQSNKKTVLFVTHSIPEAIALSDSVVVMSPHPGRIQRVIPVDLPRPRGDLIETTDAFHDLERQVRIEIRSGWRET